MTGIVSLSNLLLLWCLAPLATAQAVITACPKGAVSRYTGTGGVNYDLCAATDYTGRSTEIMANIESAAACAGLCDGRAECFRAVYDSIGRACHVKSNVEGALTWTTNARYTTIYLNNLLAETTVVSSCPYRETTFTATATEGGGGGRSYKTCVSTDYRGASARVINNVASTEACRDLCIRDSATGCARAVYDKARSVCHIKADAASNTLVWYANKRYDVIRQEPSLNRAVEGSWSDLVRLPVIPVGAYIVPAFPQSSRMLVFSSWGNAEFGGASGYTQFADYNFET